MDQDDVDRFPPGSSPGSPLGRDTPHPYGMSRAQRDARRFELPSQLATALVAIAIVMSGAVGLTVFG